MTTNNGEPKLVTVDGFNVAGLCVRTTNNDEFNPVTAKLPGLWQRFFSEDLINKIPNKISNSPILGVYSNYESDADGLYTLTAGVKTTCESSALPLRSITVLPGNYLVFENKGIMPNIVIETWEDIWRYFESHRNVIRCYKTDFELYLNDEGIAIYIGIA